VDWYRFDNRWVKIHTRIQRVRRGWVSRGRKVDHRVLLVVHDGTNPFSSITLQPIGHISSIYKLCVGTPRQGGLAPHSRGSLQFYPHRISSDSILSLEQYSHVWIIFVFHLNNNIQSNRYAPKKQWKQTDVSSSNHPDTKNGSSRLVLDGQKGQQMSKIAPPALGGEKVGIFSTRTPHRPNPIGMTLCQIDSISLSPKTSKREEDVYQVHVKGLDLVDGIPVLDIKPYIPHYDSVGYRKDDDVVDDTINSNHTPIESIQIPEWVQQGLVKRRSV